MPYVTQYAPDGAIVTYQGHLTGAEILEAKAQVYAHQYPDGGRYALCDFSGVEKFDVSTRDVQRIIEQDRRATKAHPSLDEVVVAPKPEMFGLARMWEQQVDAEHRHTVVVKTRVEAERWLANHGITLG